MHNLKKLALIIALLAMGIGATANAATTAEDKAEFARTFADYDDFMSNTAAAETLYIPLPGEAGFASYVDVEKFIKACAQLDPATVILKRNGKNISLICQSEDGGSVGVIVTENEATVALHQSIQMNGNLISALDNSFNIVAPFTQNSANEKCAQKVKEAAQGSGNYGDVKIKFNAQIFEATCQDAPAGLTSNPIKSSLKALGSFLTGH